MQAATAFHPYAERFLNVFLDLCTLSIRVNGKTATAFKRVGLGRVQAFVLLYVAQAEPEAVTIPALKKNLSVNIKSVYAAVNALVRKGLLRREGAGTNEEPKRLIVTEVGHTLLPSLMAIVWPILPLDRLSTMSVLLSRLRSENCWR